MLSDPGTKEILCVLVIGVSMLCICIIYKVLSDLEFKRRMKNATN